MTDHQDTEQEHHLTEHADAPATSGVLRSISRLMLGGMLVGMEQLNRRMQDWENNTVAEPSKSISTEESSEQQEDFESLPEELPPPKPSLHQVPPHAIHFDDLAVGLLFSTQEKVSRTFDRLNHIARLFSTLTSPVTRTLERMSPPSPVKSSVDKLIERGEHEVNRWEDLGRQEKQRSKQIFSTATHTSIDESIELLTHNKELQELVQQQSTGLAEEIMEEVRERAFSLDTLLESAVRSVFRLKPRSEIPPPQKEVREHAKSLRRKRPS